MLEKERQRLSVFANAMIVTPVTNPTRLIREKYIELVHKIPFLYIINNSLETGKLPFITTKAMKCLWINGNREDCNQSEERGTLGQKV